MIGKPVVKKLSNKEPELLLNLIKAVLEKIKTQEAMEYESVNAEDARHHCEFYPFVHYSAKQNSARRDGRPAMYRWPISPQMVDDQFPMAGGLTSWSVTSHNPQGVVQKQL
ncbi:hypothetical protein HYC85_011817 [Camellia sinensis]|uniref:Uncharacterized protein n=1 Tax=Camellia sinensis TaxID=4442 RepID=A0A7J7HD28_CAMSI|nr:hypothetical protein HYC85_011817 [Camellia sinensis]